MRCGGTLVNPAQQLPDISFRQRFMVQLLRKAEPLMKAANRVVRLRLLFVRVNARQGTLRAQAKPEQILLGSG